MLRALLSARSTGAASDRPLLIGTRATVRSMRRLLREAGEPRPLGCVMLDRPARRWGPSLGTRRLVAADRLGEFVERFAPQRAMLCAPPALAAETARLAAQLGRLGVPVRRIPTPSEQLQPAVRTAPPAVDPEVLLDREPHRLDEAAIGRTLRGRRVLITGAGGSIGAELARIAARFGPSRLLMMERAENNLFEIDRALAAEHPGVARTALLHDVTDARRTRRLLDEHRPAVIFHAAAHKHVPMMEDHPHQAAVNNALGTKAIVDAADACRAGKLVMISTDKAVRPAGVMGATKRAAELYLQAAAQRSGTAMSAVRFGNVLGSACSVGPIWAGQLAAGGPVTVTDARMRRYFMTIGEAASLVVQAAAMDHGSGAIFALRMGRPVRVIELAERFIRAHGLRPHRDVPITVTGARPGEKLTEQLAYAAEEVAPTEHEAVQRIRAEPPHPQAVARMMRRLAAMGPDAGRAAVFEALREAARPPQPAVPAPGEGEVPSAVAAV